MIYLELGDVIAIAARVLGLEAEAVLRVVDLGLLDAALARPQASFAGQEFHPAIPDKAAALLHGIVKNHAFLDGNKRVGTIATAQFLGLNGLNIDLSPAEEASDVIVSVAAGEMPLEKHPEPSTRWFRESCRPLRSPCRLVVLRRIDAEVPDEFAGRGVDDTDLEVVDEQDDGCAREGSPESNVVKGTADAKRDPAPFVDDVATDAVVGLALGSAAVAFGRAR